MIKVKYDSYLTEDKLFNILCSVFGEEVIKREAKVGDTRMRFDFLIDSDLGKYHVEFDGDQHYRDSIVIHRDIIKDEIAKSMWYRTIRIPYWLQLTSNIFEFLFGIKIVIEQNFKHGFWSTNKFPASFCKLGLERFNRELMFYPNEVIHDVELSYLKQSEKYDMKFIK